MGSASRAATVKLENATMFTVYGTPEPAGSKRYVGKNRIVDANPKAAGWKRKVANVAAEYFDTPLVGPVGLRMVFSRPRPKSHYNSKGGLKPNAPRTHTIRPDAGKLARGTMDALSRVAYEDDSQVVYETHHKQWGDTGWVLIQVWPLAAEASGSEDRAA